MTGDVSEQYQTMTLSMFMTTGAKHVMVEPYSCYTLMERIRCLQDRINELEHLELIAMEFVSYMRWARPWQWEDGYGELYAMYARACELLGIDPRDDKDAPLEDKAGEERDTAR